MPEASMVSTLVTGFLLHRFGYRKSAIVSLISFAGGLMLLAFARSLTVIGIAYGIMGLSHGICTTAGAVWMVKSWFRKHQGLLLGIDLLLDLGVVQLRNEIAGRHSIACLNIDGGNGLAIFREIEFFLTDGLIAAVEDLLLLQLAPQYFYCFYHSIRDLLDNGHLGKYLFLRDQRAGCHKRKCQQ